MSPYTIEHDGREWRLLYQGKLIGVSPFRDALGAVEHRHRRRAEIIAR